MSIEFLLTSLIIVVSPGTGVVYTLAAGLSRGAAAGTLAAFACTLGIVPQLAAALLGLAALLHASALAFDLLKYAGVAYLVFMGLQMLRDTGALSVEAADGRRSAPGVIRDGILLNLLNPKLSIFFVAFLPQFIPADDPAPTLRMLELSAVFMAMTFVVFVLYGCLAASVRRHVVGRPGVIAWLRRGFAAAFVMLGARLAFAGAVIGPLALIRQCWQCRGIVFNRMSPHVQSA